MNKKFGLAIAIVLVLLLVTNEVTLSYFFPTAGEPGHWDEWVDYYTQKDAANDLMLFFAFLMSFWAANGIQKAVLFFGCILSFFSFIDKQILSLNQWLWSDVALIIVSGIVSYRLYVNRWKTSKPG